MNTLEVTRKIVTRYREHLCVKEITSFEELKQLHHDDEVVVMSCGEMVIGRLMYFETNWILIDAVTNTVSVKPESFVKEKGFIYKIL